MGTQNLYVVLTRSNTILSNCIKFIKDDEYTHAALSLDINLQYMFSFGRRYANNPFYGCFKREHLNEGLYARCKNLPGIILELPVSTEAFLQAKDIIEDFLLNGHLYEYNYAGLLTGLLGLSCHIKNHFLCSEFVYYVLNQCGVCDLNIPRSLVRPQDLLTLDSKVVFKGNLKQYAQCQPAYSEPLQILKIALQK